MPESCISLYFTCCGLGCIEHCIGCRCRDVSNGELQGLCEERPGPPCGNHRWFQAREEREKEDDEEEDKEDVVLQVLGQIYPL